MTAAAAYGCTAVAVIVAGFGAYAASILAGHERLACLRLAAADAAARAARRTRYGRVPGLPRDGKGSLSEDEFVDLLVIELRWDRTAPEPERSS